MPQTRQSLTEVCEHGQQVHIALPWRPHSVAVVRRMNQRTRASIREDAVPGSVREYRSARKIAWSWTSKGDHSRNSLVKWIKWE